MHYLLQRDESETGRRHLVPPVLAERLEAAEQELQGWLITFMLRNEGALCNPKPGKLLMLCIDQAS